jgi:ribosomal protein L19E
MHQRLVSAINEQESLVKAMQESFLEAESGDGVYGGDGSSGGTHKASEKEVSEWIRRIREGTTTLERRREMRARWDEGRVGGWR